MGWRVDGIGNTYRHAAVDAAHRAGVPLGQWLDQVILDHPRGPTREESDRQITAALEALESRIEQSTRNLGAIIDPLKAEVDRLESVSARLRQNDSESQARTLREVARQTARIDSLAAKKAVQDAPGNKGPTRNLKTDSTVTGRDKPASPAERPEPVLPLPDQPPSARSTAPLHFEPPNLTVTQPAKRESPPPADLLTDPEDSNRDPWTRHHPHATPSLPDIKGLRRRRLIRYIGGIGAVALIVGSIAAMVWVLNEHEAALKKPDASITAAAPPPSTDQTPPPGLNGIGADAVLPPAPQLPDNALPKTGAALASLRARAQTDDHNAQYLLGLSLFQGSAGTTNPREGGEWLAAAAVAGHGEAQLQLARLYTRGIGMPRDPAQAFFWTQSAAELGITEAEYELGLIYSQGLGASRSHALAARWFRLAGAKGHAGALYQLGLIYELGLDVRANRDRAMEWYGKAADAGSTAAKDKLASLRSGGAAVPPTAASAPVAAPSVPPAAAAPPAPARVPGAAKAPLAQNDIAEIQRLLKSLDFDPGPINGRVSARTGEAIRQFQTMAGGTPDGAASPDLLKQLREIVAPPRR